MVPSLLVSGAGPEQAISATAAIRTRGFMAVFLRGRRFAQLQILALHPDESQDPEPRRARYMTLDPDFRQDDGVDWDARFYHGLANRCGKSRLGSVKGWAPDPPSQDYARCASPSRPITPPFR
ncbi:hypothetical protein QP178_06425 [Sphingomonas aurantiaca]